MPLFWPSPANGTLVWQFPPDSQVTTFPLPEPGQLSVGKSRSLQRFQLKTSTPLPKAASYSSPNSAPATPTESLMLQITTQTSKLATRLPFLHHPPPSALVSMSRSPFWVKSGASLRQLVAFCGGICECREMPTSSFGPASATPANAIVIQPTSNPSKTRFMVCYLLSK